MYVYVYTCNEVTKKKGEKEERVGAQEYDPRLSNEMNK